MHGELQLALTRLRRMPRNRIWFIPVLLNDTEIPAHAISDRETLRSIHAVKLFEDWDKGIRSIVQAIKGGTAPTSDTALVKISTKSEKTKRKDPSFLPIRFQLLIEVVLLLLAVSLYIYLVTPSSIVGESAQPFLRYLISIVAGMAVFSLSGRIRLVARLRARTARLATRTACGVAIGIALWTVTPHTFPASQESEPQSSEPQSSEPQSSEPQSSGDVFDPFETERYHDTVRRRIQNGEPGLAQSEVDNVLVSYDREGSPGSMTYSGFLEMSVREILDEIILNIARGEGIASESTFDRGRVEWMIDDRRQRPESFDELHAEADLLESHYINGEGTNLLR